MLVTYKSDLCPCRVYDANGLEWKYLRWVDTETGEAVQLVLDDQGRKQLTPDKTEVLTRPVKLATPVVIVPNRKDGD